MPVSHVSLALVLSGLLVASPALAVESRDNVCLDKADQRAAVAAHKAIPLAQVMKSHRQQGHHSELVRARLCRNGNGLVYVLTLLGRSGKVVSRTVDAANGEVVDVR